MTSITFQVPGEPRGKGRPRFAKGRTYTDAATASYENLIALACKAARNGQEPFDGPVAVWITATLQPPRSVSKKSRALMLLDNPKHRPTKRPDVENIAKAALDGMNQIAFRDDAQVARLIITKRWGEEPGLTITVQEMLS